MPAKVKATADAGQVVSTELSETKDIKVVKSKMVRVADRPKADKQTPQQFNPTENKTVNSICEENIQTPKQTAETNSVLSAKMRSKYQAKPDAYVIYPQYQSYVTPPPPPPIHAMSVPGATTTIPPGQQHVPIQHQTQVTAPYQVAYQTPVNSCEGDPVITNEQPYEHTSQPLQTCTEAQFYQYGWQYHSPPSVMSTYQPYPDPFQQFQQATLRTPYGCTPVQGVPHDPTRQQNRNRGQYQRDPKSSMVTCPKGQEYHCNWNCQVPPSRQGSMTRKESETSTHKAGSIPSSIMERADHTRTTKSSSDFAKIKTSGAKEPKNPDSVFTQSLSTSRPVASLRPTESSGNREWYRRENNLSSDSGWLSDNSSREEGEVVDDAVASPTINELNNHFQNGLCVESNGALSSTDESSSYHESQTSSISSQCPSTSDDNEQQQQQHGPATKKHQQQQPRIMRAIPSRFVNLLHAAAENAALQRKRLEGYPLFRQVFFHQRRYEEHQQVHGCGPEMQQAELSLASQYNQSASWYFPAGGYMQFQYHQNPASYVQGQYHQGAGISPYNQSGYSQGQQSSGCYVQSQQGPGGCLQSSYSQGSEGYLQNQYSQGSVYYTQPSAVYMCSDQQCGQEYCPSAAQAVPVYIIQMDNPDVANSCTLYNNADCNSQAGCEKQAQGYSACPSTPSYAIPAPVPVQ